MTASFYDAIAAEAHAGIDAEIAAALHGMSIDAGPIVDIGAGTGLTTATIAAALPAAKILAVEPDPAMRAALMTRIWGNPDLRRRVSILPMGILAAPLGNALSGAVAGASLVHFSPDDRAALWLRLAERLIPGGRIIVEIQCPSATDVPLALVAESQVGLIRYEAWATACALGSDRQHWSMTYRAMMDNMVLDEQVSDHICWTMSGADVLQEASGAGLVGNEIGKVVIMQLK